MSELTTLGIRPEDLELLTDRTAIDGAVRHDAETAPRIRGRVLLVERLGGTSHVHFEVGSNRFLVTAAGEMLPSVDDVVEVGVLPHRVHLFAADGRAAAARP